MSDTNIFDLIAALGDPSKPITIINNTGFMWWNDFFAYIFTGFIAALFIYGFDIYKKYSEKKLNFIESLKMETLNSYFTITKAYNILTSITSQNDMPAIKSFMIEPKNINFYKDLILYEKNQNQNFNNDVLGYDLSLNISNNKSLLDNVNMYASEGCKNNEDINSYIKNIKNLIFCEMHNITRINNILKFIKQPYKDYDYSDTGIMNIYDEYKNKKNASYFIDLEIKKFLDSNNSTISEDDVIRIVSEYITNHKLNHEYIDEFIRCKAIILKRISETSQS
tara:strand:+ start:2238 stop:3077 length:840 start_codon:yes stop_codon:yes gene_type:complete